MRKEVILAIIAGAILGLTIAFGIARINSSIDKKTNETVAPEVSPLPSPTTQAGITFAQPDDYDVITKNPAVISGVTFPSAWVVLSTEDEDKIIIANESGAFEMEINLEGGINRLVFSAFDSKDLTATKNLTLLYSTELAAPLEETKATASPTPSATGEESEIRQKVQQKIDAALKAPKAYLGTVTDITSETLQIKTPEGQIRQISAQKSTTVIKVATGKEAVSAVKLTDIAIGDFVVGMGYKNGNNILEAERILITEPVKPLLISAFSGQASKITKKGFTVTKAGGTNLEVTPAKDADFLLYKNGKISKIKLADIEEGNQVIIAGKDENGVFTARTIMAIGQTPTSTPVPTPSPSPKSE